MPPSTTTSSSTEPPFDDDDVEGAIAFENSYSDANLPEGFEEKNKLNLLKWSEIDFANIQEELDAIDDYERTEALPEDDPWPKFLRGAAYEHWGQPQLALAQYALTKHAEGLRLVPDIWERRAYNAFKMGEVKASNAYFDLAALVSGDATGNELHFSHWFYENFANFVPKNNGPPVPIQRGICKYCMGQFFRGRESLVAHIAIDGPHIAHATLWLLAMSYRSASDSSIGDIKIPASDFEICEPVLKQNAADSEDNLRLLLNLYGTFVQGDGTCNVHYGNIIEIIEADAPHVSVVLYVYLALYHDAFTRDLDQRDKFLDKVCSLSGTKSPNDVENFLYHVGRNRLTIPPDCKITDVPERIT